MKGKRGRPSLSPEEKLKQARKRFDEKHSLGAWQQFIQEAGNFSYQELGKKYRLGKTEKSQKEIAYVLYKLFSGNAGKKLVMKLHRPDITEEAVLNCVNLGWSKEKTARQLNTSSYTVENRAQKAGVTFPDFKTAAIRVRERIRILARRGHSAYRIAWYVRRARTTVYEQNKKYGLGLKFKRQRRIDGKLAA